ncbi:MAG: GNAT family N-acetyltransferase [Candidatus Mcinerneyibacterium aminivorans]|uniref:GNAT family N-acetyltransferase n=1 Tax=Candidatus Mcinerneyibacterium aminivorans TaxID=2703815 RepID=A0A5D0MLA2_9BACT|nr:MAG: GNAT family N-acetyltransferase [Candidatus Mcinerneyibacterium aminivorans]
MKSDRIKIYEKNIAADDFIDLRKEVGWNCVEKKYIKHALKNNLFSVHARIGNRIVGYGRVIGDNGFTFYIQDMMIRPDYQKKGIGRKLMIRIMDYLKKNCPKGTMICLMAAKGKEGFYKKFGFNERPNEDYGPGMIKLL